jgi:plastocyanin
MRKRKHLLVLGIVTALVASLAVGISMAGAAGGAKNSATIYTKGRSAFKVNKGAFSYLKFAPATVQVKSGGTLKIVDRDKTGEPHTVTIVKKSELPKSFKCPACDQAFQDHQASEDGPPKNILVNKGPEGFDEAGDSVFFAKGQPAKVTVSAKKGSTLYYLCAVHPWMQGKVVVR